MASRGAFELSSPATNGGTMTDLMIESFPATAVADAFRPLHCVSVASADPAVLLHVRRPEVNLAIWHRETSAILSTKLFRRLMKAAPFTVIVESPGDRITDRLSRQLPAQAPFDLLLDLSDLALALATINDAIEQPVRVRLDAQRHTDPCGWHAGSTALRMVCTYCGPGIEWLPHDSGAARAEVINDGNVRCLPVQLETGAVAILKSDSYPGNAGSGCIHRSPYITSGTGAILRACIDQPGASLHQ
jgi:hypothetical protein